MINFFKEKLPTTKQKLIAVNNQVNKRIIYTTDFNQHKKRDIWQHPEMTLKSSKGDCEDIASAKAYVLMRDYAFTKDDIKFLFVQHQYKEDHLVLIIKDTYVLDNMVDEVMLVQDWVKHTKYKISLKFGYNDYMVRSMNDKKTKLA